MPMQIPPLINALTEARAYDHPVAAIEVIETHISWVLLAGAFAYKIKKPVRLAFVDFSTLDARRAYCEDELRLNRRLAPQIYRDVVAITGPADSPHFGGPGPAIEYAVKMWRFDQRNLFNRLLARDMLRPDLMDRLAMRIAAFHGSTRVVPPESPLGTPAAVLGPALDNIRDLARHADTQRQAHLDALDAWTRETFEQLEPTFAERHRDGFVRECHGDLHLGNIARVDDEPVAFDCIEFSEALRCIDTINEVAFLVMDLIDHGRADLGYRFLDGYLQAGGDYHGVALLRFYMIYRALVRAKIHDLRARQAGDDTGEAVRLQAAADQYLALARRITDDRRPVLILMHGFSGSGKSAVARALVERLGAIRLRSDVERKRLFGLAAGARSGSAPNAGIYDHDAGLRTYARLRAAAHTLLAAGYPTVIDAAFLTRAQRAPMRELADRLGGAFLVVDCCADADTLRARVSARGDDPSEATIAVLERQMATHEAFIAEEVPAVLRCEMMGCEANAVDDCTARVAARLELRNR